MSSKTSVSGGQPPRPSVPMKVIVCSLPRTGTSSMKLALEQLGIHDVYHMTTYVDSPDDYKLWEAAIKAKKEGKNLTRAQWDQLLKECQAVVDAPGGYFAVELSEVYPEAKVIILNRDPEKWYVSISNTVQKVIKLRASVEYLEWFLRPWMPTQGSAIIRLGNLIAKSGVGLGSYNKKETLDFFHGYFADCRARIPAERYIEFKVQDGWDPLCKHLGIQAPGEQTKNGWVQAPFPRVNDTDAFGDRVKAVQSRVLGQIGKNMASQALVLVGLASVFGYWRGAVDVKPFW
ncbi:Uu.00g145970.m01.CDS01 [Anthostomella pinea]|uniref:Uu.00g145970.m01.CDS01 n=1 Tax=Anthostomella pinea TaxID=933095 RepID=A0AAI8YJI1_9PEZI|nr:Uu.00g145970.m01.CDS01 [Anthostomella pinea]